MSDLEQNSWSLLVAGEKNIKTTSPSILPPQPWLDFIRESDRMRHDRWREIIPVHILPQVCAAGKAVEYLLGFSEACMSQYVALKYMLLIGSVSPASGEA